MIFSLALQETWTSALRAHSPRNKSSSLSLQWGRFLAGASSLGAHFISLLANQSYALNLSSIRLRITN